METALLLYDNPASSNGLKVRILLAELGQTVTTVPVSLDGPRPESYLAVHPFGTVPCLVVGDLSIVESNTILRYLASTAKREDLYPVDPARRARVDMLLDALSLSVRPDLWGVEEFVIYGLDLPADQAAERLATLTTTLDRFERLLVANGPHLPDLTIADIAIAGRLVHLKELPVQLDRIPVTVRRLASVREREAYRVATSSG
jgi:glutathione S-transferase